MEALSLRRGALLSGHRATYIVEDEVGRGGAGAVFRAKETASGRTVALMLTADVFRRDLTVESTSR